MKIDRVRCDRFRPCSARDRFATKVYRGSLGRLPAVGPKAANSKSLNIDEEKPIAAVRDVDKVSIAAVFA